MGIRERLDDDLKQAMRAKDRLRLNTIRNVRSALQAKELDSGETLDDAAIVRLIRGLVKQRDEAIAQYRDGGRSDLVEQESAEKAVLEAYLPQAASADEIERVVRETIAELGASGMKDMGRVMKAAGDKLQGRADGKTLSAAVKAALAA